MSRKRKFTDIVPETCYTQLLRLAMENGHTRDKSILFDEEPHTYYINGKCNYTSVTTVVHEFFPEFDSHDVARNMIKRRDFATNKKYKKYQQCRYSEDGTPYSEDKQVENIILTWQENADTQSKHGTEMHRNIELFYNGMPHDSTTREFKYFMEFHKTTLERKWKPLRTEMMVWDNDSLICGSVDMIYVPASTTREQIDLWMEGRHTLVVYIVDWKRSREIRFNGYNRYGFRSCRNLPDCNYSHYTLQLNMYRYILELHYNVKVASMSMLVFHPNNTEYKEYTIPDRSELIQCMIRERQASLRTHESEDVH